MPSPIPLFKVHMPESAAAAVASTLASGYLAQGASVQAFEQGLAHYVGNDNVIAMSEVSGALTLALHLAGVGPGDEVILSPMVCLATSMPVANLRARPRWCDVDPNTGMIDPARVAELVTGRTRALIAHHWSGDVADLDALDSFAQAHGLCLIEDASEALGARYRGRPLGAHASDFCIYSFSAVRQITTGDGAALFARSAAELARAKRLRRYGIDGASFRLPDGDLNPASDIPEAGFNFPMNNIAATLGLEQLRALDGVIARQQANGHYFDSALAGIAGLRLLARRADSVSAYWTYSLRAERRAELMRKLHAQGIGCQRLHLRNDRYGCFAATAGERELPGVERFDAENLSLPCGWWLSAEDRERIVACIRSGW